MMIKLEQNNVRVRLPTL